MRHLAEAGYPIRRLAVDLGVARSTAYRWRAGRYQPNARNLAALVERVDTWYSTEVHKRRLTVASVHLRNAADALVTDRQRAEEDRLAAEVRAHMEAGRQQRRARHAQRVDRLRLARQRKPVTSITTTVADAFALIPRDQEMALAEGAF